ncbi:MAG: exodeoxyribonuclease V subunit alpha [Gammaproteobacteria bacterium]|nr:exodeoxyribonuclease V subunit alpha [Gammaproteobacteria bacterium]
MNRLLYQLARLGDISWLSFHFAEFIAIQAQTTIDDPLCLSVAMLCEANQQGSVCIDLAELGGKPMFSSAGIETELIPTAAQAAAWCDQLRASDCVGEPGALAPLTLEGNRLYLNRFWFYEDFVASKIQLLLAQVGATEYAEVETAFDSIFADLAGVDQDQKQAVLTAASKSFSVISGGPGSGKTSTVVRILSLLLALNPDCRIALAAPTGKAAARMMDSIRERIGDLDIDETIKNAVPVEARTIHRLLGYRRHGFEYDASHPLPFDCIIVDEASMVDLKLMFHLLAALPQRTQLILLGDRDQLASVAAGNVLGDITGHGHSMDAGASALSSSIALLRSNYRFGEQTAIGELASLVNQGQSSAALDLLKQNQRGLRWFKDQPDRIHAQALEWIYDAYQPIFSSKSPGDALDSYESTRVLCATNRGPLGVQALNHMISSALLARNDLAETELYHGLPIMITRNQHELGLYNGDSGILWRHEHGLRACFRHGVDGIHDLAINRLPGFVPAWASTVHKSQGSEFDSVLLVMPSDPDSEALSRELIYTAVTRARRSFILHGAARVMTNAIEKLSRRHSGLSHKLGWPDLIV